MDNKPRESGNQTEDPPDAPQSIGVARTIEWLLHLVRDRIVPNAREFLAQRQPLVWAIALAIGFGAAYLAILFRMVIGLVQLPWLGVSHESVYTVAQGLPWWIILLAPAVGGLAVGLFLQHLMPGRRAHVVADVLEARALRGCRIPLRIGLGSALVSAVSLGSGASAGREGPVVHLGATIASWLEDKFQLPQPARRTLLACGVAAAVSASFNAPIAGVFFVLEILLRDFSLRTFTPSSSPTTRSPPSGSSRHSRSSVSPARRSPSCSSSPSSPATVSPSLLTSPCGRGP